MTVQEFEDAVKKGLGRAVIYLRDHDAEPYFHSIRRAALRWQGYDTWFEGWRGEYICRLIEHCPRKVEIYDLANRQLMRRKGRSEDRKQMISLVMHMAFRNVGGARDALYAAFQAEKNEFRFARAICNVDGLAGFQYVLRETLSLLGEETQVEVLSWREAADEVDGKEVVDAWLAEAAQAHYLHLIWDGTPNKKPRVKDPPSPSFEDWKASFETSENGSMSPSKWRLNAKKEEFLAAAKDYETSTDAEWLKRLARVFPVGRQKYPGNLFCVLQRAKAWDPELYNPFCGVLEKHQSPAIRDLGLDFLRKPLQIVNGLDLLELNAEPGDESAMDVAIRSLTDEDDLHGAQLSLGNMVNDRPALALAPSLLWLYENGPCSFCRDSILRALIGRHEAPSDLLRECLEDAEEDIREMATEALQLKAAT